MIKQTGQKVLCEDDIPFIETVAGEERMETAWFAGVEYPVVENKGVYYVMADPVVENASNKSHSLGRDLENLAGTGFVWIQK